ncbi:phosphate transporter [Leishmania donovani]|uniref:Phosphate transporter n=4 Tax=Leishmania donovani species complex TaxID=38574 RepID=A0A6L0XKS3_LEIIN|nr:putative phosphate transporter [Leishmania infantum JPCM5]CAC9507433.1 phosphate_transporter_-_putative [Leishmania infantum]CAJ1990535.1 phosphate transporter [Leishmania donovani]CAM69626.1 putative phosphate transporter [Leishmania infantum JPCM5]SUZ43564.1 phosphate_transporter_-_putative [Leishmania infantum]VDZ46390.1 phosphate_transporter_putative/GeneDB:LmjF.29.0650 [Leishmania donovani]|eukprot:XP_001466587.1 putative phosphate transporter [Leishmania infantum JPCM5]
MGTLSTCKLDVNTTLPLVCMCTLLSFLCGVGIGANDLSANFAMVVGSGSLNMKQAIIYCTVFELLGAAFMGGHVSNTIRSGIVDPVLFSQNKDVVVIGMTCASFAAALWLYLSAVFGLPVSITHTVVGSILGFALFATGGLTYVKPSGVVAVVISWLAAPIAAGGVTALLFYLMRRDIFKVKGRSFELALAVLPHCLLASLLVDFFFIVLEQPPIMSQTLAQNVPLHVQYVILLALILLFCWVAKVWVFPQVAAAAMSARSFVWESEALRTELVNMEDSLALDDLKDLSFFKPRGDVSATAPVSAGRQPPRPHYQHQPPAGATDTAPVAVPAAVALPPPSLPDNPAPACTLDSLSLDRRNDGAADHGSSKSSSTYGCPTHSRTPTPTPLHQNASLVLSSISASDSSFVRQGGMVRLAPVHTRGHSPTLQTHTESFATAAALIQRGANDAHHLSGCHVASSDRERHKAQQVQSAGATTYGSTESTKPVSATCRGERGLVPIPYSPALVHSEDEFGEEDWAMDHPMQPIRFGGILIKPFNPRAEYLFTGLQVVAGSISSFVHGAVAGANATSAFIILYDAFTNHELQEPGLSSQWSMLPAMMGIAIGMFGLGASLMKTVGMELVTVTPARGWCIQIGGTLVTMVLTGIGIPVSLSQAQVGAAIGCGVLDAKLGGVSWGIVTKVVTGWVVTLLISALTTGVSMWVVSSLLCT